eukprot:749566-Hanusia_phi.AAC.1
MARCLLVVFLLLIDGQVASCEQVRVFRHMTPCFNIGRCRLLSLRGGNLWAEELDEALGMYQENRSSSSCEESYEVSDSEGSKMSYFSEETKRMINEEMNNDAQWENKTLIPLRFGSETPTEIQWRYENEHGDIQYFRRHGRPSPKFLEWKRKDIEEARLRKKLKWESYQNADEISMTASASSDEDGNWYWHYNGSMMWRPSGKKHYEPIHDYPDLDEMFLGKPIPRYGGGGGEEEEEEARR